MRNKPWLPEIRGGVCGCKGETQGVWGITDFLYPVVVIVRNYIWENSELLHQKVKRKGTWKKNWVGLGETKGKWTEASSHPHGTCSNPSTKVLKIPQPPMKILPLDSHELGSSLSYYKRWVQMLRASNASLLFIFSNMSSGASTVYPVDRGTDVNNRG